MSAQVDGAAWTHDEVHEVGEALLNWIAGSMTLGFSQPGNMLDYVHGHTGSIGRDLVTDFVAWCSGRQGYVPGCEERITEMWNSGWIRRANEPVAP